ALTFFRQAEQRVAQLGNHPVVKELYYFMGMAHLQTGDAEGARTALRNALRPAQEHKDFRKLVSSLGALADIEQQAGNTDAARKLLGAAMDFAKQADLREERKALRKKLDALA